MNRISLTISLVLLMCGYGYGQVGTMQMIPQSLSPNAAALGKYVEMPVSYYSGLPQISVPLYEFQAKDIKVPISLSYYASGIKVKEIPGWVGAGWSLSAGGLITRIVRGRPDDHYPEASDDNYMAGIRSRIAIDPLGIEAVFPSEYMDIYRTAPVVTSEYAVSRNTLPHDTEYDVFSFNFMGHTGRFTFANNGEILMLPASDLKVEYFERKFKITDAEGTVYYFDEVETVPDEGYYYYFTRDYVSSWYLSRISIPFKNQDVYFQYKQYYDYNVYKHISYGQLYSPVDKIRFMNRSHDNSHIWPSQCPEMKNGLPLGSVNSGATMLFVERIIHDQDTVRFYHDTSRVDLFKCRLDSIKVFHKLLPVHTSKLSYSYSNSDSIDFFEKKLKLDSVKVNDQPAYKFAYYDQWKGKPMPGLREKGIDSWGYYNGEASYGFVPNYKPYSWISNPGYNRNSSYVNPDYKYGQLGTLNNISWPTGGKTEFEYEGNSFHSFQHIDSLEADDGTSLIMDSVRTPQVIAHGEINAPYPPVYSGNTEFVLHHDQTVTIASRIGLSTNPVNPMSYQDYLDYIYNYGDGGECHVRLLKYNTLTGEFDLVEEQSYNPVTMIGYPAYEFEYEDLLYDYGVVTDTHTRFLEEGRYKLESNIDFTGLYSHLKVTCVFPYKTYGPKYYAGGLRIKKIKFTSPVDSSSSFEKKYDYSAGAQASSGVLESPFANLGSSMYWGEEHYMPDYLEMCMFLDIHHSPIIPFGNSQGGVIGYGRVTEKMNDGRKTVYHFSTSFNDYEAGDWYTEETYQSYIARLRVSVDNSAKRGLLKRTDYFNGNNQLVKRDIHRHYAQFDFSKKSLSMPINVTTQVMFGWSLRPDYYAMYSDRILPLVDSVYYFNGADTLKEVTKYAYNLSKYIYPSKITRINSVGDSTITHYRYPKDYTVSYSSSPAASRLINGLQDANIVSQPIETYVEKVNHGGGNRRVVDARLFIGPTPDTVFTLHNEAGLTNFTAASFTVSAAAKDSRYKPRLLFPKYVDGNVVEQNKYGDVKEVLVWGYNSRYIVARVQSSDYNTVTALVNMSILNNPSSDGALRTELNKIRTGLASSNPQAKVTTYTFAPLKGMTSSTDPAGRTVYYEYDSYGRLKTSKDKDGHTTDRVIYHYKP